MELQDLMTKVEYVKYKVDTFSIVLKDKTIDVEPAFVSEILLEYDYDSLYTPVLNVSIALTQLEYKQVIQEKDTVKFIIKINKNYYNSKNKFLYFDTFFNKTFCTHIIDENPIMEQDIVDMTKELNKTDKESRNPMDMRDIYDFALFIEDYINSGNKDLNLCIESGKMNDIIAYVLRYTGLNKNVLMTPSNNKSKISNLLCPVMNVIETFNYLQEIKGIYNKGLLFFMDFSTIYFIDKSAYCTAWRPKEKQITNIYIFSQKSDYNLVAGQMIDEEEEKNNIFTNTESTDIKNKSVVANAVYGNKTVLINSKSGSVSYIDEDLKQRGKSQTNIQIQKFNNKYAKNSRKMRLIENEYDVNVVLKDVDVELLAPNKCFKLIFQNTDLNEAYGGTYRISKILTTLTKMGKELDSSTICNFKKQNDKVNEFGDEDRFSDWNDYESEDLFMNNEAYTNTEFLYNSNNNQNTNEE